MDKEVPWSEFVTKQNPDIHTLREPDTRFYPHNSFSQTTHLQPITAPSPPPPTSSSPARAGASVCGDYYDLEFPTSPLTPTTPIEVDVELEQAVEQDKTPEAAYKQDLEDALDLLNKLLDPLATNRITPRGALAHPFLKIHRHGGPAEWGEEPDDDEFFPHPFGEGICGEWHFRDEVTEEPFVRVEEDCECDECEDVCEDGEEAGEEGGREGEEEEEGEEDKEGRRETRRKARGRRRRRVEEVLTLVAGEGIAIGRQPCEFHKGDF